MLPQIGFAEMIVLVLIAVIVVGPKDLPKLMRTLGNGMARLRSLASEFTQAFDDMGAEQEMADLRKEIRELRETVSLDRLKDDLIGDDLRDLDSELRDATDMSNPKKAD